ncbi:MAG: hypothetical protein U9M95_01030 [Candidatus Altiarchaeota archaeon]|nr:hypothetical protein [Candidatus Altiarchaeota archaeon]
MNGRCVLVLFIASIVVVGFGESAKAADYYVDGSVVDDSGDGASWATAKKYMHSGLALMSGGDTLIIADGNYSGADNMMGAGTIPSGNATDYTIVRAQNDFGVIIDAEHIDGQVPVDIQGGSYIEVHGIEFRHGGDLGWSQSATPVYVRSSDHIKFFRCGAMDGKPEQFAVNDGSTWSLNRVSYVLLEECYAYGSGHYTMYAYDSDHVIFRRCVGRKDMWSGGVGAVFSNYASTYTEFQNCIAIDMSEPRHWHPGGVDAVWGGYNINVQSSSNVAYRGSMAVNIRGRDGITVRDGAGNPHSVGYNPGFRLGATTGETTSMENCAVIGSNEGVMTYDTVNITKSTFVNTYEDASMDWTGTGVHRVDGNPIATNSLFVNNENQGVTGLSDSSDYNAYYNNVNYYSCTPRPNDYSSENGNEINVLWSESNPLGGLKYPVRIEDDSNLKGIGEGGADIGANIIKRYGVSGTLWGEPGYNTLTEEDLWPFPDEDIIKERMRVYTRWDPYDNIDPNNASNPETYVNGSRGFCADGKGLYGGNITLTSYIWEYLGNPCPNNICDYGEDTTPPTRSNPQPTGTLPAGTTTANISLTTNVQAICRYSNVSGTNYTDMMGSFTNTNSTNHSTPVTGLENGQTYTFYIRCNSTGGYVNDDDFNIAFFVDGHKADINDDGVISMPELMLFISRWKADDGVSKAEVEQARDIWFTGGGY